jgi:hypothetical protein
MGWLNNPIPAVIQERIPDVSAFSQATDQNKKPKEGNTVQSSVL